MGCFVCFVIILFVFFFFGGLYYKLDNNQNLHIWTWCLQYSLGEIHPYGLSLL